MGLIAGIKAAYIRLCERNEAAADRYEAERLELQAARKELKDTDATVAKADRLLKKPNK